MKRQKKFPTILLCFTVVFAVFISGITKPGFLLPLFTPKMAELKDVSVQLLDPPAEGNSRAFSITPEPGVTVYAEENALDRDRTFNVSRMTQDVIDGLKDTVFRCEEPDTNVVPLLGWNVDAGMTEDEILPGVFHFDVDLSQFNIPEYLYSALSVFHIDSNGYWTEMAAETDGSLLKIESRHNDALLVATAILVPMVIKGINDNISSGESDLMGSLKAMVRLWTMIGRVSVYEDGYELKRGTNIIGQEVTFFTGKGKRIHSLRYRPSDTEAAKRQRMNDIEKRLFDASETTARAICKRDKGDNFTDVDVKVVQAALTQEAVAEDPEYQDLSSRMIQSTNMWNRDYYDETIIPELCLKMMDICQNAHNYLKNVAKIRTASYVVPIFMDPEFKQTGVQVPDFPHRLTSYVRINTKNLMLNEKSNDSILVSLTHELTHVSQMEYCYNYLSDLKFNEATAQLMEETAYKYYKKNHTVTNDLDFGNGTDYHFLAIEMDGYKTSTWVSSYNDKMTVYDCGEKGQRSDCSYVCARFIEYLWKQYGSPEGEGTGISWDGLFRTYSKFWTVEGVPALSEILMQAFNINSKGAFDTFYVQFARKNKQVLYNYVINGDGADKDYFAPKVGKQSRNPKEKGGVTRIQNQDLTIKLRRFAPYRPDTYDRSKQVSLLLYQQSGFNEATSDMTFIPLGTTAVETCKRGLFFKPNTWEFFAKNAAILEVDGFLKSKTEGQQIGEYQLWTLFAPDKITPEVKDQRLRFKMPDPSDAVRMGLIDGYRVTVTPSRGGPAKQFFWVYDVAGTYVTLDFKDILDKEFIQKIREGKETSGDVNFVVSICEFIQDADRTRHFGPESEQDNISALLSEMGAHEGKVTVTLHWRGHDDLDLHCTTPKGGHISYNNKSADGGYLDVDMNVNGESDESVEHIYFDKPDPGEYSVYIYNYTDRTEGSVTADIIISVEQEVLIRDTAQMGGTSKTWKFKIEEKEGYREGGEYYIGSVIATSDSDQLSG